MRSLIWCLLRIGAVGMGVWLLPGVAGAASVGADIVEPSPTNFQSWTFKPGAIAVHVGDVVVWINTGQNPHTVTADGAAFDSGNLAAGASFSFTFAKPGTFTYKCGYHPWMKGTIQVIGAAPGAAPTATSAPPKATTVSAPPTVAPPRAAPVAPTATAAPAAIAPSPSALTSPPVAGTATSVPATATTAPPTLTSAPTTATPAPVTLTAAPSVAPVVASQPTAAATAQPPTPAPTVETASSLAGSGPIVGGIVAAILLAGVGGVVLRRLRAEK